MSCLPQVLMHQWPNTSDPQRKESVDTEVRGLNFFIMVIQFIQTTVPLPNSSSAPIISPLPQIDSSSESFQKREGL